MFKTKNPLSYITIEQGRRLILPISISAVLIEAVVLFQGLTQETPPTERLIGIIFAAISIPLTILWFFRQHPISIQYPRLNLAIALMSTFAISQMPHFLPHQPFIINRALFITTFLLFSISTGRWPGYFLPAFDIFLNMILYSFAVISLTNFTNLAIFNLLSLAVVETLLQLYFIIQTNLDHLEKLNQIANKLASTIEPHQVIALISASIQNFFEADTYFFALLTPENPDIVILELFYDDGVFFPRQEIEIGNGLIAWVLRNKKPLLVTDLLAQESKLGIESTVIGADKLSHSWLGVPLHAGKHQLGVLALASYKPKAFDQGDQELLENLAHHASMAIDVSMHHAEVEEQTRRDSLTNAANHGFFIERLNELFTDAQLTHTPLSLIMLDIDHFKQFNDTYGHMAGDELLVKLTQVLQDSVKNRDVIGRWGGEEFGILLPHTNGKQADKVAQRFKDQLTGLQITDQEGTPIPPPTISQGIAVFPPEVDHPNDLIHLADKRLYIAKDKGRNKIEPAPEHWDHFPTP